jgi:hypothetical protein
VRIPCEVTGVPIYQKGSGGPQKPFSWLSEGVKGAFTINTEVGEIACVLHLKIPNLVLTSPEQLARENQQRVQRNRQ